MKNIFLKALLSLMLLITAGCSVHERIIPDPGLLPSTFLEADESKGPAELTGMWWEQFADQKLNSLIEDALVNNLDLEQAYARLAQVEAIYRTVDSQRWPFLNFDGTAGRDRSFSIFNTSLGNTYRLSATAGYEVDLWQKFKSQSEAAWLDTLSSREGIKTFYLSLTAQLADLYFIAVEQRAQLKLVDAIIASYTDTVERIEFRYQLGQAGALAVYQARQEVAAAKQRRPVFEAILDRTEHAIAILLGRFPEDNIAGNLEILPEVETSFSQGVPADLLQNRPDIEAAFLQVKARDDRLAAAIADRFPTFNLMGSYGVSWLDFGSLTSGHFWNLLASASQPVLDGGRRKAEEDRNRAALHEVVANYRQTVLIALQEVENGLSDNRATETRLKLLEEQVSVSDANVRVAREGYYYGVNDYLPVLIAERQFFDVQILVINARRQLITDRISLIRALGSDWMDVYISQYGSSEVAIELE